MCVGGLEAAETALGTNPGGASGRITFVVDCRGDQTVGRPDSRTHFTLRCKRSAHKDAVARECPRGEPYLKIQSNA